LAGRRAAATFADILAVGRPVVARFCVSGTAKLVAIGIIKVGESVAIVVLAIAACVAGVFCGGNRRDTIAPQQFFERDGLGFLFAPLARTDLLEQFALSDLALALGRCALRDDACPRDTIPFVLQVAAIAILAALQTAWVVVRRLDAVDALPAPAARDDAETKPHNPPYQSDLSHPAILLTQTQSTENTVHGKYGKGHRHNPQIGATQLRKIPMFWVHSAKSGTRARWSIVCPLGFVFSVFVWFVLFCGVCAS
jgi:hypothetical protein